MSRLRTPEVKVIRFNEADVIVASSGYDRQSLYVANWGNNDRNDNYIRFDGKNHTNKADLLKTFEGTGYNENTKLINGDRQVDFLNLFIVESDTSELAPLNGAYSWKEGAFIWQHQ